MITKFDKFDLITESPDQLSIRNKKGDYKYASSFERRDAKPFFVEVNSDHTEVKKLHTGTYQSYHSDIKFPYFGGDRAYAGRLWKKLKVISFWVYPNEKLFVQIIKALENKLKTKIFNNGWQIEIIRTDQGIKRKETPVPGGWNDYYVGSRFSKKENQELIPVEEYAGSENQPEELRMQHLMNWEEKNKIKKEKGVKGFGSSKTAWDKPHNIKYRQTIYQENNNLIKESPDRIDCDGIDIRWSKYDAMPFFASVDKNHSKINRIYIGNTNCCHSDIRFSGKNKAYAGRLWTDVKVMSFWVYPNVKLFKEIIKKLEKKLNIKIFNNNWKIEVLLNDDEIDRVEYKKSINDFDFFFRPNFQNNKYGGTNKIIPIEDYLGSEDQPEELLIQHMLNWKEKDKLKKEKGVKGFGSAKTAWDKPHNIKWRQAIYQENKNNN